jgi:hypothetical protein
MTVIRLALLALALSMTNAQAADSALNDRARAANSLERAYTQYIIAKRCAEAGYLAPEHFVRARHTVTLIEQAVKDRYTSFDYVDMWRLANERANAFATSVSVCATSIQLIEGVYIAFFLRGPLEPKDFGSRD